MILTIAALAGCGVVVYACWRFYKAMNKLQDRWWRK
jgi:hypothetical protein